MLAFIIAEVIPFFSDLLALMSSLFDSFFGWIFWGTAYLRMRRADLGPGFWKKRGIRGYAGFIINIFIIAVGFYFLGAGTYVSRPTCSLTRSERKNIDKSVPGVGPGNHRPLQGRHSAIGVLLW